MRFIIPAFFLLLAACTNYTQPAPLEPLQFTGPTYTLYVADIRIVEDYKSLKNPPYVEHLADITPAQAVRQWVDTRLLKGGPENSLEVNIKDASIMRRNLPKQKTGIEGALTTEQTEAYDGALEVELKIYNPRSALPVAHVNTKVQQSLTLPENAAPIDRDHLYHRMTIYLMRALEQQLDENIHRYLSNYLL